MRDDPSIPPFVVTGVGRSGTGYMAALLSSIGFRCGHERVFTPFLDRAPTRGTFSSDSSWLAGPFVRQLPAGTVVLHQVRDPLAVVRSMLGTRFFDETFRLPVPQRARRLAFVAKSTTLFTLGCGPMPVRVPQRADYLGFVRRHTPEVFTTEEQTVRAMRHWASWNRLVAEAAEESALHYLRYRVEDLDVRLLTKIVSMLHREIAHEKLVSALTQVPRDTNARQRSAEFNWKSIPYSEETESIGRLATMYGYAALTS